MADDFTRVWVDYEDDLDAEALNDLESRMEARVGGAAVYRPETFGAAGDGVTDDTAALQSAIDAAMTVHGDAVVRLDTDSTYLVNASPRTDRHGNCILSIDGGAFSTKRLAITAQTKHPRGQDNPMPVIKTTLDSETIFPGPNSALTANFDIGDTTAHINTTGWPSSGAFFCQKEMCTYTGKTGSTLTGITRGLYGDEVLHDTTHSLFFTYGPPSVIGGRTVENGQVVGEEYTGVITIENVRIEIAGDPTLMGIDATSWGGLETNAVVKGFDGAAGVPKIAGVVTLPTHPWAAGVRTPTGANYGYTRLKNTLVSGMYAGHVFTAADHTTFSHAHSLYCTLAFGFQTPIDRRHAIGGGYTMGEYCQTMIAGWVPQVGVDNILPGSGDCAMTGWSLDMEGGNPTADPGGVFDTTTVIKDDNDKLRGDITLHHNGAGIAPMPNASPVVGARNLKINLIHQWRTPIDSTAGASADTNPGERISYVTGTGTINRLKDGYVGQILTLLFQTTATVNHDQAPTTGFSPIMLSGGNPVNAALDWTLTLCYDGSKWQEIGRKEP